MFIRHFISSLGGFLIFGNNNFVLDCRVFKTKQHTLYSFTFCRAHIIQMHLSFAVTSLAFVCNVETDGIIWWDKTYTQNIVQKVIACLYLYIKWPIHTCLHKKQITDANIQLAVARHICHNYDWWLWLQLLKAPCSVSGQHNALHWWPLSSGCWWEVKSRGFLVHLVTQPTCLSGAHLAG